MESKGFKVSEQNDWVACEQEDERVLKRVVTVGMMVFIALGLLLFTAIVLMTPGCSGTDAASDADAGIFPPSTEAELETASHMLAGGQFGNTSYSTNFWCDPEAGSCTCIGNITMFPSPDGSPDCDDLRNSGKCATGSPVGGCHIINDPTFGRLSTCGCTKAGTTPPPNPNPGPIVGAAWMLPGFMIGPSSPTVYASRGNSRVCGVIWAQWQTLRLTATLRILSLADEQKLIANTQAPLQTCENEEAGITNAKPFYPDRFYRNSVGNIYMVYGYRGCYVSAAQWATIRPDRQQLMHQLTTAEWPGFENSFLKPVGPPAPNCLDMELVGI